MPDNQSIAPPVTWAQRKNVIFLTFCVEDCRHPVIQIEPEKIYFKGTGGTEKKKYENTIELYKEVDKEKSRYYVRDRIIEVILVKKEDGPYWPQLLKQKVKMHWLKVDFTKWKDENDSDDEGGNNPDLETMMRQMGGLGMAGAGGGENRPNLDDLDYEDSDDDELPDLE